MADEKQTKLSIVIRTVDAATAKLKAINERIEAITKPARDFKEQLSDLRKNSGLDDVIGGFKDVGGAITDLLGKLLMIGGVIGGVVVGVLHLVSEFDDLGDKAEALGVSVDFLAQMRYAAEQSGASVEQLDGGLQAFTKNLGQAKAGTGRMTAALKHMSPALLEQLKNSKSSEEALDLVANAMDKLQDPAKKAALAAATVGDPALVPLLARGAKGVKALREEHLGLAGSQEAAAKAAGETDAALHKLHAATDGVKAAIVEGLAPALTDIVKQLSEWFSKHRNDVKEWAKQLGQKLPAAFEAVKNALSTAYDTIKPFVDSTTKLKVIAVALAGVLLGPLLSALGSLSVALLTTPVGWVVTAIAALVLAWYEVIKHWDEITAWFTSFWDGLKEKTHGAVQVLKILLWPFIGTVGMIIAHWSTITGFFGSIWDGVKSVFSKAWEFISGIVDKVVGAVDKVRNAAGAVKDFLLGDEQGNKQLVNWFSGGGAFPGAGGGPGLLDIAHQAASVGAGKQQLAKVIVDIVNAPAGTRVSTDPKSTADIETNTGYHLSAGW